MILIDNLIKIAHIKVKQKPRAVVENRHIANRIKGRNNQIDFIIVAKLSWLFLYTALVVVSWIPVYRRAIIVCIEKWSKKKEEKESRICSTWCQCDLIWAQIWHLYSQGCQNVYVSGHVRQMLDILRLGLGEFKRDRLTKLIYEVICQTALIEV